MLTILLILRCTSFTGAPQPSWCSGCIGISADWTLPTHLTARVLSPPFSQRIVSIILCLKKGLQVLPQWIQPHFPPQEKRTELLLLVHVAVLLQITPLVDTEAAGRQAMGQAKEDCKGTRVSVLPPHPSSRKLLYPFHPVRSAWNCEPHQKQMFTSDVAL